MENELKAFAKTLMPPKKDKTVILYKNGHSQPLSAFWYKASVSQLRNCGWKTAGEIKRLEETRFTKRLRAIKS